MNDCEKSNLTRWKPADTNFYEIYYLKWNDPSQEAAGWIRYTLLTPKDRPTEISIWALFFDTKDPSQNCALKQTYPLSESRIERDFFYFSGGSSAIFDSGARGVLKNDRTSISWELKFIPPTVSLRHYPFPFYWGSFPKTKVVAPYLSMRISGEFTVGARRITLNKVPAHQAHLWGTDMAPFWVWGNCNHFAEDPHFIFEGLTAQVNLGHRQSPPLTLLYFWWEEKMHAFSSPLLWLKNISNSSLDRWHFEAKARDLMFVGHLTARTEEMMGVRYENPDGTYRYCHNTKTGDLEIQIIKKMRSGWETIQTLTASKTAAFELVQMNLDPRVELMIP